MCTFQAWDGMQYGYRVNGPWDPNHGVSFNPYKLLLDPYAKGIEGKMELDPGAFAYECEIKNGKVAGSPFGPMSTVDSLGHMPVSVAIDDRDINKHMGEPSTACAMEQNRHLRTARQRIHRERPMLPPELRGTYAGLAHPATLSYLQDLGVTSIELLPIQAKQSELFLQERNRTNTGAIPRSLLRPRSLVRHQAGAGSGSGRRAAGGHRHGAGHA